MARRQRRLTTPTGDIVTTPPGGGSGAGCVPICVPCPPELPEPGSGAGSGSGGGPDGVIETRCCPGVLLPTTLYITFGGNLTEMHYAGPATVPVFWHGGANWDLFIGNHTDTPGDPPVFFPGGPQRPPDPALDDFSLSWLDPADGTTRLWIAASVSCLSVDGTVFDWAFTVLFWTYVFGFGWVVAYSFFSISHPTGGGSEYTFDVSCDPFQLYITRTIPQPGPDYVITATVTT